VCIVRVEQQSTGVRYTVRTTPDIGEESAERVTTAGQLEEAVLLVRQFLTDFGVIGGG
jgi:hypothetical protein